MYFLYNFQNVSYNKVHMKHRTKAEHFKLYIYKNEMYSEAVRFRDAFKMYKTANGRYGWPIEYAAYSTAYLNIWHK